MARVFIDADTGEWVHADTGNRISAWDVRNTEPHISEVKKRLSGSDRLETGYGDRVSGSSTDELGRRTIDEPNTVPIVPPGFQEAEEAYVEQLLGGNNLLP